jgi:lipopolysaccharide/colanic/teichoic acid biosynthesis glycosyltransferase
VPTRLFRLSAPAFIAYSAHREIRLLLIQLAVAALFRTDVRAARLRPSVMLAAGLFVASGAALVRRTLPGTPPTPIGDWLFGVAVAVAAGCGASPTRSLRRIAPLGPLELRLKRAFDLLLALCALVPAAFALATIRLLRDPVWSDGFFYRQVRTGLFGRLFYLTKVRTMSADAERDGRPRWSERANASISGTGRRLRGRWADELPQIFDVLGGRLSFVGPRPERPEFVEGLALRWPKYARRLSVPPGITGLAQVLGYAGDTSIRRRVACDRWYARGWSPWTDLRLLVATAYFAVAKHRRPARPAPKGVAP